MECERQTGVAEACRDPTRLPATSEKRHLQASDHTAPATLQLLRTMFESAELEPPTPSNDTMTPREITLIVAATNKMGIGRAGTLPWTGLKKEMAYFARVTKRAKPGVSVFRSPA